MNKQPVKFEINFMDNKTYHPKGKDIKRYWHLIDAKGEVLGRLATKIARLLMGKHKVSYSPHIDVGDNVVVINAKDIVISGRKVGSKVYRSHSGYPGGFKEVKYAKLLNENPARIIKKAVLGMVPSNRLTSRRMARLHIFADGEHPFGDKFR